MSVSLKTQAAFPQLAKIGGGCRIRTRVSFHSNGFQDRPVMTASVTLRMICDIIADKFEISKRN